MKHALRFGWVIGLTGLLAMGWSQSSPTAPVATVNGEEISGIEYFRRMEFLPGMGRMSGGTFIATYPGLMALRQLIDERLLLQVAKEKNVLPREEAVSKALQDRIKEQPDLLPTLGKIGISELDLKHQIRVELAEFNLATLSITVTDQEVEKHYADNPSLFTVPRRYKLRLIAVPEGDKAAVDADIAAGKPFAEIAKSRSKDPSSERGGDMPLLPESQFSELVRLALSKVKVGGTSDWIRGETGWFRFYVEDIKAAEKRPLDVALKEQVRRSMMLDRGRSRNNVEKMLNDARSKAMITVAQPGLEDMIRQWVMNPFLP